MSGYPPPRRQDGHDRRGGRWDEGRDRGQRGAGDHGRGDGRRGNGGYARGGYGGQDYYQRRQDDEYYNRGGGRHGDQRRHERRWDGSDSHRNSAVEPSSSNAKRSASPHARGAAAVEIGAADSKRAKSSEQAPAMPAAASSPSKKAPTAVTAPPIDHSTSHAIPENEEAYKEAFVACLRECDKDTTSVSNQAHQVPIGWTKKKQVAVEATLHELSSLDRRPAGYDTDGSSDEDDDLPGNIRPRTLARGLNEAEKRFIIALQYCPPLDAGFHVLALRAEASKLCYCPCGPNVAPWRERHKLSTGDCTRAAFEPSDFCLHLKRVGGRFEERERGKTVWRPLYDIHHFATLVYLRHLYSDWHGEGQTRKFGHKGLHIKQSKPYLEAQAEEARLQEREIAIGKREIRRHEEERARLEQKLKEAKTKAKLFRELAGDLQERVKKLDAMRDKLKVEKKEEEKLSDRALAKCEMLATEQFDMLKRAVGDLKAVQIAVSSEAGSSGFSLQDLFDTLYDTKGNAKKDARAVLFADENSSNKIAKLVLADWNIIYSKQVEMYDDFKRKKDAQARKKEDTAIDEGGPSRQFLTDVFKQLDTLSIRVGSEVIRLFEATPGGVMCITDEALTHKIENAAMTSSEAHEETIKHSIKRAKDYSRAVGRIVVHAMAHNQTLPSNAMPSFVKNVMFRGYDEDYHRDDILNHISAINILGQQILEWLLDDDNDERDENGDTWTPDTFFATYIPQNYLYTRKIMLGGLRDGLTLFGDKHCAKNDLEKGCGLLRAVPLEAIERIYFARPTIELEDLLGVLVPRFGEGDPDPKIGMDQSQKEGIITEQKRFFDGDFKRYLKETAQEDKSFLAKFVECATGSNYLPYDEKMRLFIEFNWSLDPLGLPKFHSCTCDVVLPGFESYFSDFDTFKTKMNFAINEVHNQFHMT